MFVSKAATTAQRVEHEIRKAIVTLELLPGASLSEKDLAERYGVSRQPVREALIALARADLVEIRPRRGTRVVPISPERMRQTRFVRESIEIAVVRRACEDFDPAVRRRIDVVLDAQQIHAEAQSHYLFQREDQAFHAALAEGIGCPAAWEALADIKAHIDRICHLTLPLPETLPNLVDQHRAVMAAIDARDADAAEAAMRIHLCEILLVLPDVEKTYGYLLRNTEIDR